MVDKLEQVRLGIDEATNRVFLEMGGKAHTMPWQAAKAIAIELLAKAAEAEQVEKVKDIIRDGAILDRSGAPVGLTDNPKIKEEIRKSAQWDKEPRSMPVGVTSREVVGTPNFVSTPPKEK